MSEVPPDLKALARRYLDLWQDQVAAMAQDPTLAETVARGIAAMTQAAAPAPGNGKAPHHGHAASDSPSPDPSGPPAAAVAPVGAGVDLDGLLRRIAELEGRVAVLEAERERSRGDHPGRPRRRRT
ncbi:MAG: hypothetical protein HY985_00215 [Magnetospirillum sp.]|nr:hypothetical protein [Magnetospirillum sp.]